MSLRIGIIGCGNMARILNSEGERIEGTVVAKMDTVPEACDTVFPDARKCLTLEEFLSVPMDLAVEIASQEAVRQYGVEILRHGVSLLISSIGALMDGETMKSLLRAAEEGNARVYLPSGAVGGLDAISAVRGRINSLKIITEKPPASLGVDVKGRTLLFSGPAGEAVKRFPTNINVAAVVSIAAGREAEVEIYADPAARGNTHTILVEGGFGRMALRFENARSPWNPRTSFLAALSVLETINSVSGRVVVR